MDIIDEDDGTPYDPEAIIYSPRVVSSKPRGFETRRRDSAPLAEALSRWHLAPGSTTDLSQE